ncbi:probable mitochondrial glutathione transporter SLC25A40 isoform X1 [Halichondria panicea]|uniref:probable mitochondrial glutathione transporter SLC25A40 isoform X1 n=1 Tax=Halichondria panicea TaxID=6063 RepID=UPI00312B6D52
MKLYSSVDGGTASITPLQQMLSSGSGAILTSLLTTPFDVVKVRLQAQQRSAHLKPCYLMECRCLDGVTLCVITPEGNHMQTIKFRGTIHAFLNIAKREGIGSWWAGLSPTLVMAVPATIIYFTMYDQLKALFGFRPGETNILAPVLGGSISRTIAVTAICPIELIRTKLQSRQGYSYSEVTDVVQGAVRQNGVLSLWRGLLPMLLRDVPFSISYWLGYEYLKLRLYSGMDPSMHSIVPLLSGALSGGVSAVITTPLDLIKTHMQVEMGESKSGPSLGAGSLLTVVRNVISEHGYSGLFAGLTPRVAKIAPACAIMIASYEAGKEYFAQNNIQS